MAIELHLQIPDEPEVRVLSEFPATLGRSPANDVCLENHKASRRHAAIEWQSEGPILVDLGSRNGITVNGIRVSKSRLQRGDQFSIGTHTLHVVEVRSQGPRQRDKIPHREAHRGSRQLHRRALLTQLGPSAVLVAVAAVVAFVLLHEPTA